MKNKIKGYAVLTTAALASLALTGCNEAKKIDKYLADGDYSEALDCYEDSNLSEKEEDKLKEKLIERLKSVLDGYAAGEVKYKQAQKLVDTVVKMDMDAISDETADAVARLATLNASKTAYDEAGELYGNGSKLAAYKLYAKVVDEDCNYEKAQSNMKEIETEYVAELSQKAEEEVEKGNYVSACTMIQNAIAESGIKALENELGKILDLSRQKVFEKADRFVENDDFYNATNAINHVIDYSCWRDEDIEAFTKKLAEVSEAEAAYNYKDAKTNTIGYIDSCREHLNYESAYAALNDFLDTYKELADADTEFQTYVNGLDDEFLAYMNELADKYKAEGLDAGVAEVYDQILALRPIERFETAFSAVVKEVKPYLTRCEIIEQTNVRIMAVDKDPITLSDDTMALPCKSRFLMESVAADSWTSEQTSSITFKLTGDYTTLQGYVNTVQASIVKTEDPETGEVTYFSDETGVLEFFGDDGTLLGSVELNGTDKDKRVAVDISGVKQLTIKYTTTSGDMGAFLEEFILTKDLIA